MASIGINDGDIISLTVAGTSVAHSTSHSMSASMSPIEVTNKGSAKWKTSIDGDKSWSVTGEAFFAEDAAYGFSDLWALFLAGAAVAIVWTSAVSGDKQYTGNALLTSLERSSSHGDAETFSYTLEGTGSLVESTVGA